MREHDEVSRQDDESGEIPLADQDAVAKADAEQRDATDDEAVDDGARVTTEGT